MKTYRPYSPGQSYLFPPSPHDWLAKDHLAYFVLDVVAELDLTEILAPYEREERGFPPHHPQMMVGELLRQAEARDALEDQKWGAGELGGDVPEELRHAETRLAKLRAAKAELEAEAKALAEAEREDDDDDLPPPEGPSPLPTHRVPHGKDGTPGPKSQRNFTDPDSRIQKSGDGFVQGDNCQAAVDEPHQIIVAEAVTNQPPDVEHFAPVLEQVVANCGAAREQVTADTGYFSEKNVARAEAMGVAPFIATERWKRGEPPPAPPRGRPPASLTPKQKMRRKLLTKAGRAVHARRKATVEPVFGQIKQSRGLRQFLLRGIEKVRAEWSLICMTHNLLKLYRAAAPA